MQYNGLHIYVGLQDIVVLIDDINKTLTDQDHIMVPCW